MIKPSFRMGLAGLVAAAVSGSALADTVTAEMPVTAFVPVSCEVEATALDFGTASFSSEVNAESTITVTCSNGMAYNVALDAGQHLNSPVLSRRLSSADGGFLAYLLYKLESGDYEIELGGRRPCKLRAHLPPGEEMTVALGTLRCEEPRT